MLTMWCSLGKCRMMWYWRGACKLHMNTKLGKAGKVKVMNNGIWCQQTLN